MKLYGINKEPETCLIQLPFFSWNYLARSCSHREVAGKAEGGAGYAEKKSKRTCNTCAKLTLWMAENESRSIRKMRLLKRITWLGGHLISTVSSPPNRSNVRSHSLFGYPVTKDPNSKWARVATVTARVIARKLEAEKSNNNNNNHNNKKTNKQTKGGKGKSNGRSNLVPRVLSCSERSLETRLGEKKETFLSPSPFFYFFCSRSSFAH